MPSVVTDPGGYLNFYLNFTEVVDTFPLHRIVDFINLLIKCFNSYDKKRVIKVEWWKGGND